MSQLTLFSTDNPGSDLIAYHLQKLVSQLDAINDDDSKVIALNGVKKALHRISPMSGEPVDCVLWVRQDSVGANDYNPNSVAPPEMELLKVSILEDGYTQPIVTFEEGQGRIVVDGFHRNRVGKECPEIRERVKGYLPVVTINEDRKDKGDRIASTIRHNRARGKHKVDAMSDIVVELKRRNWTDEKICRELGMDPDEVLRLCQITGLAELFNDTNFSKAWDIEGEVTEDDFQELTDDINSYGDEIDGFRAVNTDDENRIFHVYEKWECYKAGFYNTTVEGKKKAELEEMYRAFLSDCEGFALALDGVINNWKHSCEHYLTNSAMNRIAWLGQASVCYALGVPSAFRGGFSLLTDEQQLAANETALVALNRWMIANNRPELTMDEALSYGRQSNIY